MIGYAALARGREDFSPGRGLSYIVGVVVLWVALETPIDTLSDYYLQSVHMLQHVMLGLIAPPLLVLGLSPSMAATLSRIPGVRPLTEPVPAQVLAAAVMVGWHLPPLYDATENPNLHIVEHLTFIASGVVFWWPVLDATSARSHWRLGEVGRLVYLLVGTIPQDGVAIVLQFSRVPFYDFYRHAPMLVPGWDAVIDQNVAGTVLQLVGKTSYLVAAIVIFFRWVAKEQELGDPEEVLGLR
ncbi:MAG TPA: cytochrome c oxidase assembly protein [Candidatus Dormibacteraeota bacterium]